MPSSLAGGLGHLGTHPDDMPSGHPDLTDTLGYWPEDMPSGPPDIHSEHVGHLGHLGYLCHRRDDEPLDLERLKLLSRMPLSRREEKERILSRVPA
jgi:hypothetical protein